MTTTRTIILKDQSVAWPLEPVPFRYWETVVQAVKRLVPDEAEQKTVYFTPETRTFSYQHTLSELEEAQEAATEAGIKLARIRALLPRIGEALSAEEVTALRDLVGV